jgi:hypothetical protein
MIHQQQYHLQIMPLQGTNDMYPSNPIAKAQGPRARYLVVIILVCCVAMSAAAKTADCFTTDDGSYRCEFRMVDAHGSFEVSASGKPTYILEIFEPGIAFGYLNLGQRNIPLPGRYLRSSSDPACWVNDTTKAKICAR